MDRAKVLLLKSTFKRRAPCTACEFGVYVSPWDQEQR